MTSYPPSHWPAPKKDKRECMTPAEAYDLSNLANKVVLITGPTNGLGAAMLDMIVLSKDRPSKVILVGRNAELLAGKAALLTKAGIENTTYKADLVSPKQTFKVCEEIKSNEPTIHLLGLNAGAWLTYPKREFQEDGYEKM